MLPTVQGTLAETIHRITGETVLPQGSGRTDTGVHALAQVATFSLTAPIPAANLHRALNRALPASIRVLSVEAVPEHFHARHNALRKTYEYRILPCGHDARICPPFLAPYVWPCRLSLDLVILQQAASDILGTHDFTSFAATDPDLATRNQPTEDEPGNDIQIEPNSKTVIPTEAPERSGMGHGLIVSSAVEEPASLPQHSINPNIRTILHSTWQHHEDLLIYRVTGSGFLHHMVRNLVGTFVECASNRRSPDSIPEILAACNRAAAGLTAPARGLFLVEVDYE
jgi:tRNA pseudouridine38-40 synthase